MQYAELSDRVKNLEGLRDAFTALLSGYNVPEEVACRVKERLERFKRFIKSSYDWIENLDLYTVIEINAEAERTLEEIRMVYESHEVNRIMRDNITECMGEYMKSETPTEKE